MARKMHPKVHAPSHEAGGDDEVEFLNLTDRLHASKHQNGGDDEISLSGLSGQKIFVPYNNKIADIKESDTNTHFLNLQTALSETRTITVILLNHTRVSGTGILNYYPNEGSRSASGAATVLSPLAVGIAAGTQRLQYAQSVANDDFDVYCLGYWVVS